MAPERPSSRTGQRALHIAAAAVVVVGVGVTVLRPLAPDLGPIPDPGRWFDAAYLEEAAAFRGPRYIVAALGLALRIAVPCLVAFTPLGRRLVARLVDRVGAHRPVLAATAVILAVVVATDLIVLPAAFWMGYIHDGAYGFRTQGLGGWLRDWLLASALAWGLVALLASAGWWLARRLPDIWPPVAGLSASVVLVVIVAAAPLVLEPLELRTEPLAEGSTRTAVENVVLASGEEINEIVVGDASRRSTRQNAYVSGLGATRRIVLYDTLIEAQPPPVVAQVVAHELAHHRNADLGRSTLLGAAGLILAAYGVQALMAARQRRGGGAPTDPRSAAVVLAIVVLMLVASHPVQNMVSRQLEAAADLGGLELTNDPVTFIEQRKAVTRANLGDPAPPRWAYLLWSSHPAGASRLEMGERWPQEWRGPVRP